MIFAVFLARTRVLLEEELAWVCLPMAEGAQLSFCDLKIKTTNEYFSRHFKTFFTILKYVTYKSEIIGTTFDVLYCNEDTNEKSNIVFKIDFYSL